MHLFKRQRQYLVIILLCFSSASAIAQDLRGIGQLARDGAPGLALQLLSNVQPSAEENLPGWLFFERQRIEILRHWGQWQILLDRLNTAPATVPPEFRLWASVEQANAYLQLEQGGPARAILRQLIWQTANTVSTQQFSLYRRLIIRSYLVDDNLGDAQRAMRRYQQDYGNKGHAWRKLRARILLRTERAAEVVRMLNATEIAATAEEKLDAETMALRLLAQLRSGARTPQSILGDARRLAQDQATPAADQVRLWRVAAEAAKHFQSYLTELRALESAAVIANKLPRNDELFVIRGDDLWQAYQAYAIKIGNGLQLLIGQDERWLQEAAKWQETEADKARALYSIVMLKGVNPAARQQAYTQFLASVQNKEHGIRLLNKLFLDSQIFPTAAGIPDQARYLLVDDALARNAIDQATGLMQGLEAAPPGADAFEWGLRRARVLVLGGQHAEGISVLTKLINIDAVLDKTQVDRLLQVVFDLQTVNQHAEAIVLFDRLLKRPLAAQTQRELLFWKADSYKALDNLSKAAWFYLQSATIIDAVGMDPWGQTARFRAAEVLTQADLPEDARRIYEGLLKVTAEPARRAMLKNKLQELWLK